ncbi:hypothetical protein [Streptomyces sp. NBC_00197]|uniref:hypothetical protein n=1 Tax=Streptomyces sp. NBC_00197 TaxID=2975676 RepID=UPI00324B7AC3
MTEQTPEKRLEALEAEAFRSGRSLAELRTEIGHIYRETRGLADWTARLENGIEPVSLEQRFADIGQELDFMKTDLETVGDNVLKIMRHLGIPEGE